METTTPYVIPGQIPKPVLSYKQKQVLNSKYFDCVKDFACSLLASDRVYEHRSEVIRDAVALTEAVIQRVGEIL